MGSFLRTSLPGVCWSSHPIVFDERLHQHDWRETRTKEKWVRESQFCHQDSMQVSSAFRHQLSDAI